MQSKMDEPEKLFTKPDRKMCPDHQEEDLRFFCLKCEIPICRDCKVVSHEGHKADLVASVAKGMREKLVQILDKTELKISKLKEKVEDTSEKADYEEEVHNDEDTLNEIKNIANETKVEIDKLVGKIECEIKIHYEEPNAERMRDKMEKLVTLKESVSEAMDSDHGTVTSFKALVEDDTKYSEEEPEDKKPLTRAVVKENLLSEFKIFFGEIGEDIRNFNVKGIASGQLYAENCDDSQYLDNDNGTWGLGLAQWFRSAAKELSGIRLQSLRHMTARLSLQSVLCTCFWLLQLIFCSLPILQSVPVFMLLFNAYPDVHPVVSMVVSGICVSSGLFMLSGIPRPKYKMYGALLLSGILAFFAFYPYLDTRSAIGTKLIWSRQQGCIGLYFIFAGRKSSSKVMETVGNICTVGYVLSSALILLEDRVQILFPGGKLVFVTASVLFVFLTLLFAKETTVKYVTLTVGCSIVLASSLIFMNMDVIDAKWKDNFEPELRNFEYYLRNNRALYQSDWINYQSIQAAMSIYEKQTLLDGCAFDRL